MMRTLVAGSSDDRGSSRSSTEGSVTSERARATRCCSPPEISRGDRPQRCEIWNDSRISCIRRFRSALSTRRSPYMTLSWTERWGKRARSWKTKATLRRAGSSLTLLAESKSTRPPTAMRPSSGSVRPAMQRSSVVLPAPEWPTITVTPGAAAKVASSWKPDDGPAGRLRSWTWSSPGSDDARAGTIPMGPPSRGTAAWRGRRLMPDSRARRPGPARPVRRRCGDRTPWRGPPPPPPGPRAGRPREGLR